VVPETAFTNALMSQSIHFTISTGILRKALKNYTGFIQSFFVSYRHVALKFFFLSFSFFLIKVSGSFHSF
jgi:hypothetical protein